MFCDTHAHLNFPALLERMDSLYSDCLLSGVNKIVVPGVDRSSWQSIASLSKKYRGISPAFGMHPIFIFDHKDEDILALEALLRVEPAVALGEIGLDKRVDLYSRQLQLFEMQLSLAERFGLPVILHCVKAHDDMLRLLSGFDLSGGVIHGFSGGLSLLERYVALGMHIGVGVPVTRENSRKTREAIALAPLERLVLETDCPDMRVSTNMALDVASPLDVCEVFRSLCDVRQESLGVLKEALWENSLSLFSLGEF